jgi:hypothetical protein
MGSFTPGGINAVLATAAGAGANLVVISTVQSLRLFVVVLLTPPVVRWAIRGYRRHPGATHPVVREGRARSG